MSPRFQSTLGKDLQDYLTFRRSMGVRYESAEFVLRRFDRFVADHFGKRKRVDLKFAVMGWLATLTAKRPVSITNQFLIVRKFCLYLRRRDPAAVVPDRDWAPRAYKSHHIPHIFSPDEIRTLLDEIGSMRDRFRSHTYRVLLLIFYCTGLRTREAVQLKLRDVHWAERTFYVEYSKGKSRWVPFEETLARELFQYHQARLKIMPASADSSFLVQPNGSGLNRFVVSHRIRALLRQTGLKPLNDRTGPRPYDTRHSFAVTRLTEWYREGVDLQERLPWLSAYMGHDDLLGTQVYLHLTPELRRVASFWHERYVRHCWKEE